MGYYTYGQKNPTFNGAGAVKEVGVQAKKFGCTKVCIVTDPGLAKTDVLPRVQKSLKDEGIRYVVFDKVNVDPLDTICEEGAEFAKQNMVDGIVGLGGGSSLDCSKAIDLLFTNPAPLSQYYESWDYKKSIPLFLVPTTAGTGSENTIYGVISDTKLNCKKVIFKVGDYAICDPELTYGLPPALTAATGMDAFAHAAETMTGLIQNPHTDALGIAAIERIVKWLPTAVKEPGNKEARAEMMLASNFAGIGFTEMGCHLGHAVAQCMGGAFHVTHGIACAWALPATIAYAAKTEDDKVKMIADAMGLSYSEDITPQAIGTLVAEAISELMKTIHLQPMSAFGITRDGLIGIADMVMADNCWPVIPSPLSKAELEEFLGQVYDSYLG